MSDCSEGQIRIASLELLAETSAGFTATELRRLINELRIFRGARAVWTDADRTRRYGPELAAARSWTGPPLPNAAGGGSSRTACPRCRARANRESLGNLVCGLKLHDGKASKATVAPGRSRECAAHPQVDAHHRAFDAPAAAADSSWPARMSGGMGARKSVGSWPWAARRRITKP